MNALPPGRATAAPTKSVDRPKALGFLHIARHDGGATAVYVVTYHHVDENVPDAAPVLVEGARALIELLEHAGVDFRLAEARGALADILRFGSATIPDLELTAKEAVEKGLAAG